MTKEERKKISKICQKFAGGFKSLFGGINGTGWLIVDPMSGYLNAVGFENTLAELPENEGLPQVLIMTFKDGSMFIPAGGDLKPVDPKAKNWMWIDKAKITNQ